MVDYISTFKIIRASYPVGTPGRGIKISEINGIKVEIYYPLREILISADPLANPSSLQQILSKSKK